MPKLSPRPNQGKNDPAIERSAAYLRVSSRAQDAASQRSAIERAAAAQGRPVSAWYSEKRSGKVLARPELIGFGPMLAPDWSRDFYVFRLDRLTRSGIRDTFDVVEELRRHGCELVSVADGFSLEGPAAEVVLAVMAWAAKMERLAINERIASARDRLEAEGRPWGRPRTIPATLLAQAGDLRAAGRSLRQVATELGLPLSTLARSLSRKVARPNAA